MSFPCIFGNASKFVLCGIILWNVPETDLGEIFSLYWRFLAMSVEPVEVPWSQTVEMGWTGFTLTGSEIDSYRVEGCCELFRFYPQKNQFLRKKDIKLLQMIAPNKEDIARFVLNPLQGQIITLLVYEETEGRSVNFVAVTDLPHSELIRVNYISPIKEEYDWGIVMAVDEPIGPCELPKFARDTLKCLRDKNELIPDFDFFKTSSSDIFAFPAVINSMIKESCDSS